MTATFCSQQQKVALVNCRSIIDTYSISSNNQICCFMYIYIYIYICIHIVRFIEIHSVFTVVVVVYSSSSSSSSSSNGRMH